MNLASKPYVKLLTWVWWALVAMTLISALVAESIDPTASVVLAISVVIAIKGRLVVDWLMGMKSAPMVFRQLMLAYFYVVPLLIALALIFPDTLQRLTTL
ncbi:cytochrome C oxidase subunit IV family protein [Motiliproteus sp.]|uniref:cytochrome C oxidase subunit IV family protein n=1 Tax=Motiliproteus sp. TaxID=1898955 RepID=UPI003BA855FF